MTLEEVYSTCRHVNPYLAILALGLVAYRVAPTIFVLGMPTFIARALFGAYIFVTALTGWENERVGNEPIYVSAIITALHCVVIVLFALWDFGLSRGVQDLQLRTQQEEENR